MENSDTTETVSETAPAEEEQPRRVKPSETVDYWKQRSRENEEKAKANADAARELDRIRESQKTSEQRTAEALQAAERRAAEAESQLARLSVAVEKGLTPGQAKRLIGNSREELEADAEDLLTELRLADPAAAPAPHARRPIESLRPGAAPAAPPADNTPRGLISAGLAEADSART